VEILNLRGMPQVCHYVMLLFKRIFLLSGFNCFHGVYEAICFHYLLTASRRVNKWITSNVSLISTGLYASNGFDGMTVIVMAFVVSIC
jgi:hypothetical protein